MSRYTVYVVPEEFQAAKKLPGNIRHRIKQAIDGLTDSPKPPNGKQLIVPDLDTIICEVWRLRIENWRIVYLVSERDKTVDVVAVRKRPPYDYGDLAELLRNMDR